MKRLWILLSLSQIILFSCKPDDREFDTPTAQTPIGDAQNILEGSIRVNEFESVGSVFSNDLDTAGQTSDWLELYNNTLDTIYLGNNNWFLTDSLEWPNKWAIPDTFIKPNSFLVIWCDDKDTLTTTLHANFKLSSAGEDIGLFVKKTDGSMFKVDGFNYVPQTSGVAQARYPDGTVNWIFTSNPSPSLPNVP
jgi:hypothetical protein